MEEVGGNLGLFEGRPGAKVTTMRPDLRSKGQYEFAEKMVLWSLINGGPGLPILSASHYLCLAGKEQRVDVQEALADLPDPAVRDKIEKVRCSVTES